MPTRSSMPMGANEVLAQDCQRGSMFDKQILLRAIRRVAAGMLLCLLAGYVATYVTLRNRSVRELKEMDSDGLLYDSVERDCRTHDMSVHNFSHVLFWPANDVDGRLFNGPDPVTCFLFDLS